MVYNIVFIFDIWKQANKQFFFSGIIFHIKLGYLQRKQGKTWKRL